MSTDLKTCHLTKSGNIVTPKGVMWFCAVARKFKSEEDEKKGQDGAYKVSLIVPPSANLELLKKALFDCAKTKWPQKPGQFDQDWQENTLPDGFKWPFKKCSKVKKTSGEKSYPEEFQDWYQINASTFKQMPNVIDAENADISTLQPDESTKEREDRVEQECYSGRFARISVKPATFMNQSAGVKLYLQNVQVLEHGERRGGASSRAEDDFAPVGAALPEGKAKHGGNAFD